MINKSAQTKPLEYVPLVLTGPNRSFKLTRADKPNRMYRRNNLTKTKTITTDANMIIFHGIGFEIGSGKFSAKVIK